MHPSTIEWTEATWNPIRGCFKVSPGCKHCCAEAFAERFRGVPGHPYEHGFDVRLVPHKLAESSQMDTAEHHLCQLYERFVSRGDAHGLYPHSGRHHALGTLAHIAGADQTCNSVAASRAIQSAFRSPVSTISYNPRLTSRFVSSILIQSDVKREPKTLSAIFRAQLHER